MQLHQLEKPAGSTKNKKRVGRGPGSGWGKTCGKGQKGQKARSGGKVRRGFEGGQTPLARRLPKFGFNNIFKEQFSLVNLSALETNKKLDVTAKIDKAALKQAGLIKKLDQPVKLLGSGEITKGLTIEVDKASKSAIEKITAAGGKVIELTQEGA